MQFSDSPILAGLMGLCVADALGVPVEFSSRADRTQAPVDKMLGYGTWNQPPGTWSDDSSLTFCLAEALCAGFSLDTIATNFCRWYSEACWTPHGEVFDVGNATAQAIHRLQQGVPPLQAGGTSDRSNGNGSLMRILPIAFYQNTLTSVDLMERVHQVSSITHAHPKSQIACGIYVNVATCLLNGLDLNAAYLQGIETSRTFYTEPPYASELSHFERVLSGNIATLPVDAIRSGGYVIDTLEASLWCLLNSNSYSEAVLKAVNLGEDTDTTATVTGGLAGIHYGLQDIPVDWINQIARKDDIVNLANRLESAIQAS
jgi:ADP-ribosyl-[dinitrogen reductase] hydrolase